MQPCSLQVYQKKKTLAQMFSCEFCKLFQITFLIVQLRVTYRISCSFTEHLLLFYRGTPDDCLCCLEKHKKLDFLTLLVVNIAIDFWTLTQGPKNLLKNCSCKNVKFSCKNFPNIRKRLKYVGSFQACYENSKVIFAIFKWLTLLQHPTSHCYIFIIESESLS